MAALLSIALFPIGLVAVVQTQSVARQAGENAELALLALTERAASRERIALAEARGVAETLSAIVPEIVASDARCSQVMMSVQEASEIFSLVAFLPTSGIMTCTSTGGEHDFSGTEAFRTALEDPRASVTVNMSAPLSGTSVIILTTPVYEAVRGGELLGFVTLSIPHRKLALMGQRIVDDAMVDLITFNAAGDILTMDTDAETAATSLPAGVELSQILRDGWTTADLPDQTGAERIYTLATIEPGQVYALGVWDRDRSVSGRSRGDILTSLFPGLMWLIGLVVALTAVHRLVTRHLQVLGRQMALFTAARRLPEEVDTNPPTEIRRIQRAFHRMTEALVRDEARQEDAVREKSVLVKEIHHRVKNNLQLISSIINMQIRGATSPEAKQALRQTQDRVLSMATIHRDLYQTNETGLVDVGKLITEVVGKTIEITPDMEDLNVDMEVGDIWLYPDQAVPMSLLAAEAVINALKHMARDEDGEASRWLKVSLARDDNRVCTFSTSNAAPKNPPATTGAKGMGRTLIQAFATQLGGQVETRDADGTYALTVTFTASEFAPLPGMF
jgi:two-component sensor histidine kinase